MEYEYVCLESTKFCEVAIAGKLASTTFNIKTLFAFVHVISMSLTASLIVQPGNIGFLLEFRFIGFKIFY